MINITQIVFQLEVTFPLIIRGEACYDVRLQNRFAELIDSAQWA